MWLTDLLRPILKGGLAKSFNQLLRRAEAVVHTSVLVELSNMTLGI